MYNKMLDSLFCECGGKYQHIDQDQDDDGVLDSYQCDQCQTWCLIQSDPETEEELKREYSVDEDNEGNGTSKPVYKPFDGDYDPNRADDLIKFAADLGDFGVYRELCLSMEDDNTIRVLASNDAGDEWQDDDRYDVPAGWTVDQARDLFQHGNIYFHVEGAEFPDEEWSDDED